MLKSIIFADEITLWWDKTEFPKNTNEYKLYLNGVYHGDTKKTHYTFTKLKPNTEYTVQILAFATDVLTERRYTFQTKTEKKRIDVTLSPYGAVGDGQTLNTLAIQRALNDCKENEYVYFPAGIYVSGALDVHSNTEIYLDEGAVLQGTAKVADYCPQIKSRFEGVERMCYRSLLNMGELDSHNYGYHCKNVIIRGKGSIFGGGRPLAVAMMESERERIKEYLDENQEYVKTCETPNTIPGRVRGRLINMSNCENVILSSIKMGYGPSWNIHFVYSKNIVTYGCEIYSDRVLNQDGSVAIEPVWNGDGWDPDSSQDCVIFNTVFKTYDDCIAIKSGKNPEGNTINRPTKNIYIFDCKALSGHSISIGSEMSGGVENVYIWDCDLANTLCGIQVKTTQKRGGYVKNMQVDNCVVSSVYVRCATYNDDGEGAQHPPKLCDYRYENIKIVGYTNPSGLTVYVSLNGFEEKEYHLNNVYFNNIVVCANENDRVLVEKYVDGLTWNNVKYIQSNVD